MMHEEEENNEIEEEFSMSYKKNNTTGKVFFILLWIVVGLACVMLFYVGLSYYVKKENEFAVNMLSTCNPQKSYDCTNYDKYQEMKEGPNAYVGTGVVVKIIPNQGKSNQGK